MQLEEAIEYLEQLIGIERDYKYKPIKVKTDMNTKQAIETILQAFKDDEKIINEMSKYLTSITDCPRENANADLDCKNRCTAYDKGIYAKCWKLYFKNKVKE